MVDLIKGILNWVCKPEPYMILMTLWCFVAVWKPETWVKPKIFWTKMGFFVAIFGCLVCFGSRLFIIENPKKNCSFFSCLGFSSVRDVLVALIEPFLLTLLLVDIILRLVGWCSIPQLHVWRSPEGSCRSYCIWPWISGMSEFSYISSSCFLNTFLSVSRSSACSASKCPPLPSFGLFGIASLGCCVLLFPFF